MREKGKLVKKFAAFCILLLAVGFISAICLQAQNQEKETKDKTDIKSESAKNTSGKQEDEKEAAEDIKPPKGEHWYEPGDEEIYTLKLNIQRPKEGITGGKLIYFGVYIEPPYKVEVKDHSIFVNGINISTSPDGLLDKIHQRDQAKKEDYVPKLSIEEIKMMDYADKLRKVIKSKQEEIFNKYNRDYEANAEAVDKEFREYLQSNPEIIIFNYYDFRNVFVRFRLPNGELSAMYLLSCYCRSAKQKEARDLMWENRFKEEYKSVIEALSNAIVICHFEGTFIYHYKSNIFDICKILEKPFSREEKIAKIYAILGRLSVNLTKLYYYNFDPVKFGCVELDNEKK